MQSVPITTTVMSSYPAHGEMNSIQHYLKKKIVSDLIRQVDGLLLVYTPISSTNKTDCHNVIGILLKVVLNTITPHIYRRWNIFDICDVEFARVIVV
jgi:hypothetical protein